MDTVVADAGSPQGVPRNRGLAPDPASNRSGIWEGTASNDRGRLDDKAGRPRRVVGS
jgi:hypothetical protein